MTTTVVIPRPASIGLRRLSAVVVAATFALLALGVLVTSFRVGMADPVWPTVPWYLFTISWSEPTAGFLIEHVHRLAGFVVGGLAVILCVGLWVTEPNRDLRRAGLGALVLFVLAYGQMHGQLIGLQKAFKESGRVGAMTGRELASVYGPTLVLLIVVAGLGVAAARSGRPGGGTRAAGVALLVAVMIQGVLGGLRVYLNALCDTDLAAVHGTFSQIVLALAVGVAISLTPRLSEGVDETTEKLVTWAAVTGFAQAAAGAVLRHTDHPLGPRLHLITAFAVTVLIALLAARVLQAGSHPLRRFTLGAVGVTAVQLLLGVEAWLVRSVHGLAAGRWQVVTVHDAVLRSAHSLTGYLLFGLLVAAAVRARQSAAPAATPHPVPALEGAA